MEHNQNRPVSKIEPETWIKNNLTVTRGEGEGDMGGKVKSRNMSKGPKDKDNGWGD